MARNWSTCRFFIARALITPTLSTEEKFNLWINYNMVFQRDESSYRLTALEDEWAAACDEQNVTWPPHRYVVLDRPSGKAYTGRIMLDCIENEAFAIVIQPRQAHIAFSFEHHFFRENFYKSLGK